MIGERVKIRREELGMTQEELANKIGYKHKSSISYIEKGKNDIPISDVYKFADALCTTVQYLMELDKFESRRNVCEFCRYKKLIDAYNSADNGLKFAVNKLLDIKDDC